jgi:hypothetical protein
MNTSEITNDDIRRALLGFGNPNPDEGLEMRIFSEDATDGTPENGTFAERLSASADDLIDDYLGGGLSLEERVSFEGGYLRTPDGHRRLVFAAALDEYLDSAGTRDVPAENVIQPEATRRSTWLPKLDTVPVRSFAQAALVVLAVAGALWMLVAKLELEDRIGQMAAERVILEQRIESLREARQAVQTTVATALLAPGLLRGLGEVERVIIPDNTDLVRFQLDLGIDDYEHYRAALHDASGEEFWTQSKLRASETGDTVAVTVSLPSEHLPRGDYYFRLSGVTAGGDLELIGRYHFRVLLE